MEYYPECLCHHGVKGMKWGVRKDRNRVSNSLRRVSKKLGFSKAAKSKKTVAKSHPDRDVLSLNKSVNEMSNEELKAATNRLNLENNYINQLNTRKGRGKTKQALDYLNSGVSTMNTLSKAGKYVKKGADFVSRVMI